MNNYWKIYWLTRLDAVNGLLVAGVIISAILVIGFFFSKIEYYDDDHNQRYGWIRNWGISLGVLFAVLLALIPTQNQAIMIIAGGAAVNYVESDTALQKVPYKATEIITSYMDKKIDELKQK